MNYDIILHIGPRKCGKSLFVEKELETNFKHNLYIGTLLHLEEFSDSIYNHQQRRNSSWSLYEISNSMEDDFVNINKLIKNNKFDSILIDGLTTWVLLLSRNKYDMYLHSEIMINNLIYLLRQYDICIRLIDVTFDSLKDIEEKNICMLIQECIITKLNFYKISIKIINWGNEDIQNFMD